MARYDRKIDWFSMWEADKKSIIETMNRNMQADIAVGYDLSGNCIQTQRRELWAYCDDFRKTLEKFRDMTEDAVQHWCFYDLKARGAIE